MEDGGSGRSFGFVVGATEMPWQMRANRATSASQKRLRFARLAQILRSERAAQDDKMVLTGNWLLATDN
jgi:hypothetical protein